MSERIQSDETEPITVLLLDSLGAPVTGATVNVTIRQSSSDDFWTGTALSDTITQLAMTEVDASDAPGEYRYNFDTSAGVLPDGEYLARVSSVTGVANLPQVGIVKVGEYVDDIDAAVSSRATQAEILSDATPFQGADIAPILADTAAIQPTVATNLDATVSSRSSQTTQDALRDAVIAADLTAAAGSTSTEIRTGATQANDFYNGTQVMVINTAGVAIRAVNDFTNTNGAFIVDALPFTPAISDRVIVLARLSSSTIDNGAIADAVWDEAKSGHVAAGTFGESVADLLDHTEGDRRIDPIAGGWQEVVYDSLVPATEVARYDLFDTNGAALTSSNNPIVSSGLMIGRRIKV